MSTIRRRLRLLVHAWLLCHVTCLFVLLPVACCTGDDQHAAAGQTCHREAAVKQCPMRAANGTPCPMHRDSAATSTNVAMRGTCSPLEAALAAVLFQAAVPLARYDIQPTVIASRAPLPTHVQPSPLRTPPDSPPPRV